MAVIEIGAPKLSSAKLRDGYDQFKDVYAHKPVHDNVVVMKAPHAFAAWFMMRTLQPKSPYLTVTTLMLCATKRCTIAG